MLNIKVETKPINKMRYLTAGDYYKNVNVEQYDIIEMNNLFYEKLVLIHEIVEWMLLQKRGVKEEKILAWDLQHENIDEEPGSIEGCPYLKEHMIAETIEHLVCLFTGLDWDDYCKELEKALENKKEKWNKDEFIKTGNLS